MFVDDKRFGETPQPVLGLADFISWLETRDPNAKYDFGDIKGNCLVGQYLASRGVAWVKGKTMESEIYQECTGPGACFIAVRTPWTYGAALNRARKVLLARERKERFSASGLAQVPTGPARRGLRAYMPWLWRRGRL